MSLLIPTKTSKPSRISYGLYSSTPLPRGQFKNYPAVATKVCSRCLIPLSTGLNITAYRFNRQYYLCTGCYSIALKGYNEKRPANKKAAIQARKSYLQEEITKLMNELSYLVGMGY